MVLLNLKDLNVRNFLKILNSANNDLKSLCINFNFGYLDLESMQDNYEEITDFFPKLYDI